MNIIERIRAEIERLFGEYKSKFLQYGDSYHLGLYDGLSMAMKVFDTLEEPEQPTRGYDEAYLNEKIAKASKSWKGVDVDKFMDEIRGREQPVTDCNDLEEAAKQLYPINLGQETWVGDLNKLPRESFIEGAKWQKAKMMEEAIAFVAQPDVQAGNIQVPFIRIGRTALFRYGIKVGDKVKIIITKEEKK